MTRIFLSLNWLGVAIGHFLHQWTIERRFSLFPRWSLTWLFWLVRCLSNGWWGTMASKRNECCWTGREECLSPRHFVFRWNETAGRDFDSFHLFFVSHFWSFPPATEVSLSPPGDSFGFHGNRNLSAEKSRWCWSIELPVARGEDCLLGQELDCLVSHCIMEKRRTFSSLVEACPSRLDEKWSFVILNGKSTLRELLFVREIARTASGWFLFSSVLMTILRFSVTNRCLHSSNIHRLVDSLLRTEQRESEFVIHFLPRSWIKRKSCPCKHCSPWTTNFISLSLLRLSTASRPQSTTPTGRARSTVRFSDRLVSPWSSAAVLSVPRRPFIESIWAVPVPTMSFPPDCPWRRSNLNRGRSSSMSDSLPSLSLSLSTSFSSGREASRLQSTRFDSEEEQTECRRDHQRGILQHDRRSFVVRRSIAVTRDKLFDCSARGEALL